MKVNKLLESLRKGKNGDWEKEGYSLHTQAPFAENKIGHDFLINAHDKHGNRVGSLRVYDTGHNITSSDVHVHQDHRRKGLASGMYAHAEAIFGKKMIPADQLSDDPDNFSDDAQKLWSNKNRPFGNNTNKLDKAMTKDPHNTLNYKEINNLPKENTLDYSKINTPKAPTTEPKTLDYSKPEMKRDPKKDPNWKQGADKAKMAQHTKNNPNIIKGINDQHYVMPPKALDKSAEYDKEVNDKIAKLKEKYADKTPKTMEQKVADVKDRYSKLKPAQLPEINQHIVAKDQLAAARDKHKTSKVLNHLKTLKEKAKTA